MIHRVDGTGWYGHWGVLIPIEGSNDPLCRWYRRVRVLEGVFLLRTPILLGCVGLLGVLISMEGFRPGYPNIFRYDTTSRNLRIVYR